MLMGVKTLIFSVMPGFCVDFCAMLLGTLPISTRSVLVIRNAVSSSLREFPGFRKALTLLQSHLMEVGFPVSHK